MRLPPKSYTGEMILLGVNIDHVATVRQARKEGFPNVVDAAMAAVEGGAEGITAHLREDRRHIQDADIVGLKAQLPVPLNLEMAVVEDIVKIAEQVKPAWSCLVPEKRLELTTEGGLNVKVQASVIKEAIQRLHGAGVKVSLFVEPDVSTVQLSRELGADAVELHTGTYARLWKEKKHQPELERIAAAAKKASESGLLVNAGHGIDYENVGELKRQFAFHEFNIGFSIIGRAMFVGMKQAVREMKEKL